MPMSFRLRNMRQKMSRLMLIGAITGIAVSGALFLTYKSHGLYEFWQLEKQLPCELKDLEQLQSKVAKLNDEILNWKSDLYYLEKVAREDLHLARTDEKIFIVPFTDY